MISCLLGRLRLTCQHKEPYAGQKACQKGIKRERAYSQNVGKLQRNQVFGLVLCDRLTNTTRSSITCTAPVRTAYNRKQSRICSMILVSVVAVACMVYQAELYLELGRRFVIFTLKRTADVLQSVHAALRSTRGNVLSHSRLDGLHTVHSAIAYHRADHRAACRVGRTLFRAVPTL